MNTSPTGAEAEAVVVPAIAPSRASPMARLPPGGTEPASGAAERDSFSATALSDVVDRSLHAAVARFTLGLSPAALFEAYFDWAIHLTFSPGKRMQLADKAFRKGLRLANYIGRR